jgi:hypothetical protein
MAQPHRETIQQAQELAARRHPIQQEQRVLSRLRRHRSSQTLATLCPRGLVGIGSIKLRPSCHAHFFLNLLTFQPDIAGLALLVQLESIHMNRLTLLTSSAFFVFGINLVLAQDGAPPKQINEASVVTEVQTIKQADLLRLSQPFVVDGLTRFDGWFIVS